LRFLFNAGEKRAAVKQLAASTAAIKRLKGLVALSAAEVDSGETALEDSLMEASHPYLVKLHQSVSAVDLPSKVHSAEAAQRAALDKLIATVPAGVEKDADSVLAHYEMRLADEQLQLAVNKLLARVFLRHRLDIAYKKIGELL